MNGAILPIVAILAGCASFFVMLYVAFDMGAGPEAPIMISREGIDFCCSWGPVGFSYSVPIIQVRSKLLGVGFWKTIWADHPRPLCRSDMRRATPDELRKIYIQSIDQMLAHHKAWSKPLKF